MSEDEMYVHDSRLTSSKIWVPALPFPLAANLMVLYFANKPESCKYNILPVAMFIGGISVFLSIINLVAKCIMFDAWSDGKLTKKEHSVLWSLIIKNRVLILAQVTMFFFFLLYLLIIYRKMDVVDPKSANYCSRHIFVFCTVLSGVMTLSAVIAASFYFWFIMRTNRKLMPEILETREVNERQAH